MNINNKKINTTNKKNYLTAYFVANKYLTANIRDQN